MKKADLDFLQIGFFVGAYYLAMAGVDLAAARENGNDVMLLEFPAHGHN